MLFGTNHFQERVRYAGGTKFLSSRASGKVNFAKMELASYEPSGEQILS